MQSQRESQNMHKSTLQMVLITWNISLSSFYFGYSVVYLASIPFPTIASLYDIRINMGVAQGVLNGCIPLGGMIGALLSSKAIAIFSRKNNVLLPNALVFLLGILIYIPKFYTFLLFRLCQGVCVGLISVINPLIIRQITPVYLSGILGSFVQINITFGIMAAYLAVYLLTLITGDIQEFSYWHIVFALSLLPIAFQTVVLIFVYPYETPKYLLLQGCQDEAVQLLEIIYKSQYVGEVLEQKLNDIKQLQLMKDKSGVEGAWLATLMAVHIASLQQLSGMNAINFYIQPILNLFAHFEQANLIPVLVFSFRLLIAFISVFFIHRFGRKVILQVGLVILTFSNALIAVSLRNLQSPINQLLTCIGFLIFVGSFGLSLAPLSWLIIAETAQPKTIPFAVVGTWLSSFAVVALFPILKQNVLGGDPTLIFVFFSCWALVSLGINHFCLLQTKDKTQQQIRQAYLKHKIC